MAGAAKLRNALADKRITFDFSAPDVLIGRQDRDFFIALTSDGSTGNLRACATKKLIEIAAVSAFPQGMDFRDGEIDAQWKEIIEYEGPPQAEVTLRMLDWLEKHIDGPDVRFPPQASQWRIAVSAYIDDLRASLAARLDEKVEEKPGT